LHYARLSPHSIVSQSSFSSKTNSKGLMLQCVHERTEARDSRFIQRNSILFGPLCWREARVSMLERFEKWEINAAFCVDSNSPFIREPSAGCLIPLFNASVCGSRISRYELLVYSTLLHFCRRRQEPYEWKKSQICQADRKKRKIWYEHLEDCIIFYPEKFKNTLNDIYS